MTPSLAECELCQTLREKLRAARHTYLWATAHMDRLSVEEFDESHEAALHAREELHRTQEELSQHRADHKSYRVLPLTL